MSIVDNHNRGLDARVERIQAALAESDADPKASHSPLDPLSASTISTLTDIARSLSAGGSQIKPAKLLDSLQSYDALQSDIKHAYNKAGDDYIPRLAWVVAAKASVRMFALVTNTLLEQAMPLNDGIYYWNQVLGSYFYTGLYTVQTSPIRVASRVESICQDMRAGRGEQAIETEGLLQHGASIITDRWNAFYSIVSESVRQQALTRAKLTILSPFARSRAEVRDNRRKLTKLREANAWAVGLLMDEGLDFSIEGGDDSGSVDVKNIDAWKDIISRSAVVMRIILKSVNGFDTNLGLLEQDVSGHIADKAEEVKKFFQSNGRQTEYPHWVIRHLLGTLEVYLPEQQTAFKASAKRYGRPSWLVRYWLPASVLLFSSSTVLNLLTSRRAELITWVRELGLTVRDFWQNWVLDPLTRLIGTIRHDEDSEIALMGKQSLEADLGSLERMVVDFAVDHPSESAASTSDGNYSAADIEMIRSKVKQGDLTTVLTAYERDLRRPLMGTIRGDLVRALLIQVQKTKVDVEIAVSGIDSMLKSQELVFGFIALTPGILVSYVTLRWILGTFGSRRGIRQGKRRGETLRALRGVDRVLIASTPTSHRTLSHEDHGLLICEAEILRQRASETLPGVTFHEFQEDLSELLNVRAGIKKQLRVLERIRWAYASWIH